MLSCLLVTTVYRRQMREPCGNNRQIACPGPPPSGEGKPPMARPQREYERLKDRSLSCASAQVKMLGYSTIHHHTCHRILVVSPYSCEYVRTKFDLRQYPLEEDPANSVEHFFSVQRHYGQWNRPKVCLF